MPQFITWQIMIGEGVSPHDPHTLVITRHVTSCDTRLCLFFFVVAQFDLYLLSSQSSVLTVSHFHEQHSCTTRKVSISPPSLSLSLSYALPICFVVVSSIQEIKWPVYICDSKLFLARQPVATQFCLGCSYFTLKKFQVISRRFSKYWLKFKIWPAWCLWLKKKKFLKTKQIYIMYTKKSQKEKKEKKKKKLTMWFIYH